MLSRFSALLVSGLMYLSRVVVLRAATADKDARHVTFKDTVGMTPCQAMYGEKKDVSGFWTRIEPESTPETGLNHYISLGQFFIKHDGFDFGDPFYH